VFRQIGGHAYGHTYPGPIGILLTAMLEGPRSARELAHASSLCGACLEACPVGIDIPRMLIDLRTTLRRERIVSWRERVVFQAAARLMSAPGAFALARRLARAVGRPFGGRPPSGLLGSWTAHRDLPPLAPRSFTEEWRALEREDGV
jgi:L-lactate dehydrogenase complex protein LldF